MPESASVRAPILAGGISKQAAEVRSAGQVGDALNADFVLAHGMLRRAGTRQHFALGATLATQSWIGVRTLEGGDKPITIVKSDGTVRVIASGAEVTVHTTNPVVTYLSATHDKRPICASADDEDGVLRISNPAVIPEAIGSPAVNASGQKITYTALECFTPTAPGQVWRAKEGSEGKAAGLYRYIPGTGTYATAKFAAYTKAGIDVAAQNPRGFRLFYSRFLINATGVAQATPAVASGTISTLSPGAAATGYVFQPGDQVYISSAGNVGAWNLTGYAGGLLFLDRQLPVGGNVDIRGIGKMAEVSENFVDDPVATMEDAAVRYTNALRAAGLENVCVHWEDASTTTGSFVITANDGGPLSGFNASYTVFAPTASGVQNDSAAGWAFNAPTVTAGTGAFESFSTKPADRWIPVPAPEQDDAILDPDTMPVRLRKIDTSSYEATAIDLGAWHYFGLGDSASNATAKDSAEHSLGTYTNAPTRAVTSLLTGGLGAATTFDGVNDYVTATTWWALGDQEEITVEMLVATTAGAGEKCLFHMKQDSDLYVTVNKTAINRITVYASGGEFRCDVANFTNGSTKHLTVSCTATSATVYVNGVAQTMTTVSAPSGNPGIGSGQGGYTINIARRIDGSMYFPGTIDEVAVYPFAMLAATALYRYQQATNTTTTALWAVEQGVYAARTTGDSETNPVPSFVTNQRGIEALAVWQNREAWGAGKAVTIGRADGGTAFFVNDIAVVTDADPIDRVIAQEGNITHLKPFGSICVATTDGPVHYELSARGGGLTPATLNSRAGLRRAVSDVAPAMVDQRIYLVAPALGSGSAASYGTLMEGQIDEQAVAAVYDDVGQHIKGLVNPADLADLTLLPVGSDGKIILAEIGGSRLFVYQTAFVGPEKRQGAWTVWNIGGTIQCADADEETVYLVVLRSGKYLIETWRPDPRADWPAGSQRLDGRVSVTGGAYALGVTTFTMPTDVPATGIDTVVKADGTSYAATPISATQFTVAANLSGVTVTAGRSFSCWAILSRPFIRDLNGQAYLGQDVTLSHTIATASDLTAIDAVVTNDSRSPRTFPFRELRHDPGHGSAWTRGPAGRTTVKLTIDGVAPNYIGTVEQVVDSVPRRT